MAVAAFSSIASNWVSDVRRTIAGQGTAMEKRTTTALSLALLAAVAPLDISQLALLIIGAVAYALLQPVPVPMPANRPAVKTAAPAKGPRAAPTSGQKYVPPALRGGFDASKPAAARRAAPPTPSTTSPADSGSEELAPRTVRPVAAPTFRVGAWDLQVEALVAEMLPTAAGDQALDRLAGRVRRVLSGLVPNAEVFGFSSSAPLRGRAFGVAVPDADIVVSCDPAALAKCLQTGFARGSNATTAEQRQLQKLALRAFTERLVASGDFRFRRSAFAADEPKVTLLPVGGGEEAVPIDITVNSATPLHNAALLRECGRLDARAQALALLVRRWARDRGICHAAKGHLSPYCWTLLTIYFLQAGLEGAEVLPALDGFQVSSALAGKTGKAAASKPVRRTSLSVGALFQEFVAFYSSKFDVRNEAVSVRLGRRAPPALTLPLHIVVAEAGAGSQVGISVEDPFDPRRNLGTTLNASGLARFHEELARAAALARGGGASLTALLEPWAPEETTASE